MLLNCVLICTVIGAARPANLYGRNIPVEVRYHDTASNLAEKPQLSDNELIENNIRLEKLKQQNNLAAENFTKNLDEKNQPSHQDDQLQSSKYISGLQENTAGENENHPGESSSNKLTWLQQVQQHFEKGLEDIRRNYKPSNQDQVPDPDVWNKLEEQVRDYFASEKNKLSLKQDQGGSQQNFFQNLASGFQQITNNFVQSFQGGQNGTQSDDGQPVQGAWQGFVGYFQGGVQNLVSTVQNFGGGSQPANSTVLGDSGSQPPNFFGNIVGNVQQIFQGQIPGISQPNASSGAQADTDNTSQRPQGFFAGAVSQFNQVVGNIIPTQPPQTGVQGDEGASSSTQGPIQQIFGNIGTAFNQFIQGGSQPAPSGSQDETSTPQNPNFIQSIGQNIGNAIQNFQSQFIPGSQNQGGVSNPIVEQASNVGTQIQQLVPGSSTESTPAKQSEEESDNERSAISQDSDATNDKPKDDEKSETETMTTVE